MSLAARAEAHHKQTYSDNVKMVAQQLTGRIRPSVTEESAQGEAVAASDLVGNVDAVRVSPTDRRNIENVPNNTRRWLTFPDPIKSGQYITTAEKMQRAMDPTAIYTQTHTKAVVRGIDDICLGIVKTADKVFEVGTGGVLGAAVEGKNPGGARAALPATCYTPANSSGLTLEKLKNSKERLNGDEFGLEDDDELFCAITPKQVTDLLNLADGDGTSLNAFQQLQLQSGKPTTLLGYTWIVTNRLPFDATGDRMCPIWAKSNVVMGIWEDITGAMWNDTSQDYTPYARVQAYVEAVRCEDLGVQVLLCQE